MTLHDGKTLCCLSWGTKDAEYARLLADSVALAKLTVERIEILGSAVFHCIDAFLNGQTLTIELNQALDVLLNAGIAGGDGLALVSSGNEICMAFSPALHCIQETVIHVKAD